MVTPQSQNIHKLPQKRISQQSEIRWQMVYFYVNCIHFRGAVFVHVWEAQLCMEIGVSFYMCSAVEVACLAQNIRKSSTCV